MQPNVGTSGGFSVFTRPRLGFPYSTSQSFIFRVHKKLREVNERAYEPEIVSIGPYHHGKPSLQMMEVQKLLYLQLFLKGRNENNPRMYIRALEPMEDEVRSFYAENISLDPRKFVEMMLIDGFFIIEVILRFRGRTMIVATDDLRAHVENDPIFKMPWMVNSLQRDLMLFENQLPYVLLEGIMELINPSQEIIRPYRDIYSTFLDQALVFFSYLLPTIESQYDRPQRNICHLLELVHNSWIMPLAVQSRHDSGRVQERKNRGVIQSATELQEAGVKLKAVKRLLFGINFEGGVMEVPSLTIEGRTETFFRNLVAYEQYRPGYEPSPVTDYVRFLDCLIDTPKDVEVLSRLGIIDNWLGDDKVVSTMFNKISEAVVAPTNTFHYGDIFARVNEHCSRRWNKWMATLKRDYFNSPWAWISVLAAVVLLVLAFTQTVFAVFPRK